MVQKMVAILLIIGAMVIGEIGCTGGSGICMRNEFCLGDTCCRLPYDSFSDKPYCMAKSNEGEGCDPSGKTYTARILARDGSEYDVVGIYRPYCPCVSPLVCTRTTNETTGICQQP